MRAWTPAPPFPTGSLMSPDPQSAVPPGRPPSRAERLQSDLNTLLKDDEKKDGAELLPSYASAEPGALLHEMHEVWTRQGGTGEYAHSFAKLKAACSINSLQHKLKGRLPIEDKDTEDVQSLLSAMLNNWGPDGRAFREDLDAKKKKRLAEILFGPIYGVPRREIRIVESPGINAAKFMEEQRTRAKAIVIPVTDRAMFGRDPADTLDGTRLSVAQYLGEGKRDDAERSPGAENAPADSSPKIIYALRSEPPNITKDYVRYIYERSFLSTLFRLVQQTSGNGWEVEYTGKRFPPWENLERQLWVCVSPADRRADDIIPVRVPESWKDVVEGGIGPGGKFGLAVVCTNYMKLEYWKYSTHGQAFSKISQQADKHMEDAHRRLIQAVFDVADGKVDGAGKGEGMSGPSREPHEEDMGALGTWVIASAEDFMRDRDLPKPGGRHEGPGG